MITAKVHAPSDTAHFDWMWRDYWVKHCLSLALQEAGARVVTGDADLDIYLWGWTVRPINLQRPCTVIWVIGHPERLLTNVRAAPALFRRTFSAVFCSSKAFCTKLAREHGLEAEWLVCPAPERPPTAYRPTVDLAFVGDANRRKNRHLLASVLNAHESVVWGQGWRELTPRAARGDYIHWNQLPEVWSSARLVPYSHHQDMAAEGFVADAALDVAVNSEALVVPDFSEGLRDVFGASVRSWTSEQGLQALVRDLLNDTRRAEVAASMRASAARFTYAHAARRLIEAAHHAR